MNEEQIQVLRQLRTEGYAVCVFTPEELEGANPHLVEDRMCEMGWDVIDTLKEV